jgi:cytochrome c-type biogenesis protein CcmH
VSGWFTLAALLVAALALLRLLGLKGSYLQLGAAALLFGCAGYALQGNPGLAGSPREAQLSEPPLPLASARHAFFGEFTPAETWIRLSEALEMSGNTEDAVGALQAAVRQHPQDPELWIGLGNALVDHAGVLTPASELAYRRAAELAPGHPAPLFFMGLALARSGEREGALGMWHELLASAPADAPWRPMVEDGVAALARPPQPSAR